MIQRLLDFSFQRLWKSTRRISLDHVKVSQVGKGKDMKLDFFIESRWEKDQREVTQLQMPKGCAI